MTNVFLNRQLFYLIRAAGLCLAFFTFLGIQVYADEKMSGDWYSDSAGIMGTNIYVEVWADSPQQANIAIQSVFTEMQRINQLMSPYIETSELSRINQMASTQPLKISTEMFDLLSLSKHYSELSKGAFDITFASVGYLFDYRQRRKPDNQQIDQLLSAVNYQLIELNEARSTVFFRHQDVKIDLGGIAKGHAVDNAIEILRRQGIQHALVTAGGDTKLLGDRRGRDWLVGIRDPRNSERQAVLLPLIDTAMSTSGDYERYFEEDGERYHHILSPKTGRSVKGVQSVSIVSDSSTANDALSTAVFVLGVEQGLSLINSIPEVDAIIMDADRKMHYSASLYQSE